MPETKSILQEASEVTQGGRNEAYGDPKGNHETTGFMFQAYLRRRYKEDFAVLDAQDVCVFNICQKLSRLAHTPYHRDSLVDIAGYAANIETIGGESL